jgi:hypothetical protein
LLFAQGSFIASDPGSDLFWFIRKLHHLHPPQASLVPPVSSPSFPVRCCGRDLLCWVKISGHRFSLTSFSLPVLPVLPVLYPYESYNVVFLYLQKRAQASSKRFLFHKPNLKRLLSPPSAALRRFGGGDPVGGG